MNMGTHGTPQGDTIFRSTLVLTRNYVVHLPHQMLVAVPLTVFGGLSIMNILLAGHYLVTLLAASFTCLSPYSLPPLVLKKEWPPLFDGPLKATSVRDFWSHRWHALFRRTFLVAGGKPGAAVGGYLGGLVDSVFAPKGSSDSGKPNTSARRFGMRLGGVLGVFLASGLLHDWGVWGIGRGTEFRTITGYFLLQGVIVVIEEAFGLTKAKRPVAKARLDLANGTAVNGNSVATHEEGGYESLSGANYYLMKVWTFVWVVFPATLMIDAWLRRGAACVVIVPHSLSPARALLRFWNDFAYGS